MNPTRLPELPASRKTSIRLCVRTEHLSEKREKDALISKARHNLKNPVNAILGFSEMLIEDCEDEGFEDILPDLKKIHGSGKEILKIIEESLSDSNVELSGSFKSS